MKFSCPYCDQHLDGEPDHAGLSVDCPACHRKFTVPTPAHKQGIVKQKAPAVQYTPIAIPRNKVNWSGFVIFLSLMLISGVIGCFVLKQQTESRTSSVSQENIKAGVSPASSKADTKDLSKPATLNHDIQPLKPVPTCPVLPIEKIQCIGKAQELTDKETGLKYYQILGDKNESRLEFTSKVDGTKQNYVTLRFKGGSKVHSSLFLRYKDGKPLPYPQDIWFGGLFDDPSGGEDGKMPGFFFYATVSIPRSLTDGKDEVTLSIYDDNPPSRNIYRIYSHTESFFKPLADDKPFKTVKPYRWPKFKPFEPGLVEAVDRKFVDVIEKQGDRCMREQLWAPDWKEKVKKGEWPADMIGGSCIKLGRWKNTPESLVDVKHDTQSFYNVRNNMGPLTNPYAGAMAYVTKGTKQYLDKEWLERIALALDFTRRAQGASGSFFSPWTKSWVGGPKRGWADGKLEGNAHWAFCSVFVLTGKDMEKAGLLDQLIDDDCDPNTPLVTRRQAYKDLFCMSARFLSGCVGHAPNQEMFQLSGVYPAIKALEILKADKKYFPDMGKMDGRIKALVGDVELGNPTWVSPKGITLESWGLGNGGYTCEYGREQVTEYWYLYEMSGNEAAKRMCGIAGNGFTHFVYPVFREDGKPEWKIDGYFNWRHRMRGGSGFGPSIPCAVEFKNPYHIRLLQLQYSGLTPDEINKWGGAAEGNWFYQSMMGLLKEMPEKLKLFSDFPAEDVMLPMESGAPDFVWGDEIAQVLSFKDGEKRVMMCMNQWYKDRKASGYAFIHYLSPEHDIYAVVPHDIPIDKNMFALNQVCFGDYFIVMNSCLDGKTETVEIPADWAHGARKIINLGTGDPLEEKHFTVKAQDTHVFKRISE